MTKTRFAVFAVALFFTVLPATAYRFEEGSYYAGGGFGANVNVVRYAVEKRATPRAELPVLVNLDYAFDQNIGIFGTFMPQFGAGSVAFAFRGGAKYWFTILDAPYVPYVSLALTPSFLFPMVEAPNHVNLGLSPGVGMNYFIMAKFMVGAHVHFNPSVAFVDGDRQFELGVMAFFDVAVRM